MSEPLFDDSVRHPREPQNIARGAVWIANWLEPHQQRFVVSQFHQWVVGPVPIRAASVHGHPMSVRTVCLGWHWRPYAYSREAVDVNGQHVLPFPEWMTRLGQRAVLEATGDADVATAYQPDAALVNYYDADARLGMHQDKDERSNAPVVSLSIGDTCTFRFGNTKNRGTPYRDIALRSGDLFVFGGESRLAYHGVVKVARGTAPPDCGLDVGRINITMRVTGLS